VRQLSLNNAIARYNIDRHRVIGSGCTAIRSSHVTGVDALPLGVLRLLEADVPVVYSFFSVRSGHTAIKSARVTGGGPTAP
jgi:hypothetical protein